MTDPPQTTRLIVPDSPKTIREALCVAQTNVGPYGLNQNRRHLDVLGRIIAECDRHRPLGPDGKHGDRCTESCGCDTNQPAADRPAVTSDPAINFGRMSINGVPTSVLAERVREDAPVDDVAHDYGLTRRMVLTACWFEAHNGEIPLPNAWRKWAHDAHPALATGRDPGDPPAHGEAYTPKG